MSKYEDLKFGQPLRKRLGVYLRCEQCTREFYVNPARVRQVQANGNHVRFCSFQCYKTSGVLGWRLGKKLTPEHIAKLKAHPNRPKFSSGPDNPNFTRFAKDFPYQSPPRRNRSRWRRTYKECQRCGYNRFTELLQVHHKDRNRKNNQEDNLVVLCPNCHHEDHFAAKDGFYSKPRRQSSV